MGLLLKRQERQSLTMPKTIDCYEIPLPVVEQTDDGLVRISVGDQIACISTTQRVQPTVHRLTKEWLLKFKTD